jgi:hypothetical protein
MYDSACSNKRRKTLYFDLVKNSLIFVIVIIVNDTITSI